ncbi:MAG: type II toxin-antitoxin system VapC family toxin [Gammaproteobacteria bacterium]|nr:type II toxin-antitoxin system VapC family toxin [Gammaproteobacteria bacterium]
MQLATLMINIDTHILLFELTGQATERERELLSRNECGISAIVLWELAKLKQKRRISVDLSDSEVKRVLSDLRVWPVDIDVAVASTRLDFESEPADELIAATSVVHGVPLLTRDSTMLRSTLVPLV